NQVSHVGLWALFGSAAMLTAAAKQGGYPRRRGVERGTGPSGPVRKSFSEVALGAELEQDRVLILELIERGRLRSGRREHRRARHLLVEMEPLHFAGERQV